MSQQENIYELPLFKAHVLLLPVFSPLYRAKSR